MKPIRILIADDHTVVREGLRVIFSAQSDLEVAGEARDGVEALEQARKLRPDVILMDIAMPNLNGLEAIGLIREAVPDSRIVVLSMHAKENYVQQVLASGALGYVLKASPSSDILEAVRSASRGEYFLSPKIRAGVIDAYLESRKTKPPALGYDLLTDREQQVFRLVVEGKSTREIADFLCVSPKTVEKHRANVTVKLGVQGRLELLKYAIKIGVVNPELWEN